MLSVLRQETSMVALRMEFKIRNLASDRHKKMVKWLCNGYIDSFYSGTKGKKD
jgi:hypothetical protein